MTGTQRQHRIQNMNSQQLWTTLSTRRETALMPISRTCHGTVGRDINPTIAWVCRTDLCYGLRGADNPDISGIGVSVV